MSDRYYTFENFKYGLDGRKSSLTEVPGTLLQCVNAFVNAGGEPEQRKSFAKDATQFPAISFGLQDTAAGLVTFGSSDPTGINFPTGVTYQRLQHPTGFNGGTPIVMVAVVFSTTYQGKAFVLAQFSDNNTFAYYNGALVTATRNGQVLTTSGGVENNTNLGDDLAAIVNAMSTPGWAATNVTGTVTVDSPAFIHFTPVPTFTSASSGQIGAQLLAQNGLGISALSALAKFTLTGGASGSVTLTAPAKADGTGTAALTNGAIPFDVSLTQTATDIATAVNNNTFITGYSAVASVDNPGGTGNPMVTIYAPTSFGNFTFNLTITLVTITTGTPTGTGHDAVVLTLTPRNVSVQASANAPKTLRGSIQAQITGGVPSVTVAWAETNSDGSTPVTTPSGISISTTGNVANNSFSKLLNLNTVIVGYFKCTATDGASNTSVLYFSVTLELDSNL